MKDIIKKYNDIIAMQKRSLREYDKAIRLKQNKIDILNLQIEKARLEANAENQEATNNKIAAKNRRISVLENQIETKKKKMDKIAFIGWKDGVIIPLAEKIAEETGMFYEIFNAGDNEETICLFDEPDLSVTNQNSKMISIRALKDDQGIAYDYMFRNKKDEFEKLPQSTKQIVALMKYVKKEIPKVE